MTKGEIYTRLNTVFRDVFDDGALTVRRETTAEDIAGWDSLTHITLITAIEDEFGLRFDMKTVLRMKNVGEMADMIEQLSG